jgi:antitoxin ParD1/3/4
LAKKRRLPVNIHLTPELEQLVQSKVQSGRYNSASEVVREALRIMEQRDEVRSIQLQELRSRIDKGLAEADRGEGIDGEVFMQGLIDGLDTRRTKRRAG